MLITLSIHSHCIIFVPNSIRSVVTSVAGSLAGVLGLINLTGFYLYLGTILFTNLAILLFNVHFDPQRYLFSFNPVPVEKKGQDQGGKLDSNGKNSSLLQLTWPYLSFLLEGAQEMAFGYVLWWTLWTALIHGAYEFVTLYSVEEANFHTKHMVVFFSLTVFD